MDFGEDNSKLGLMRSFHSSLRIDRKVLISRSTSLRLFKKSESHFLIGELPLSPCANRLIINIKTFAFISLHNSHSKHAASLSTAHLVPDSLRVPEHFPWIHHLLDCIQLAVGSCIIV